MSNNARKANLLVRSFVSYQVAAHNARNAGKIAIAIAAENNADEIAEKLEEFGYCPRRILRKGVEEAKLAETD